MNYENCCRVLGISLVLACQLGWAAEPGSISLPLPQTDGGKPFLTTLKDRKSVREFSAKPVPLGMLSTLLWAGCGVNRATTGHRTVPSAMNSQEIELYVALAEGLFLYDARTNCLKRISDRDVRPKTGGQDFVKTAPVALVFVANLDRLGKARLEDRERYAWMDAGFISQNIYLYCASEGLGTVIHELDRAQLKDALKLGPDQTVILAQSVGYPKQQPTVVGGTK
jgi:SagB-type dehydrogenase family enzyme